MTKEEYQKAMIELGKTFDQQKPEKREETNETNQTIIPDCNT